MLMEAKRVVLLRVERVSYPQSTSSKVLCKWATLGEE